MTVMQPKPERSLTESHSALTCHPRSISACYLAIRRLRIETTYVMTMDNLKYTVCWHTMCCVDAKTETIVTSHFHRFLKGLTLITLILVNIKS